MQMPRLDRLFKRTATGAIQVWEIEVEPNKGRYRTISGQLDGQKVTSEWTVAKPKNAGRANATTPQEQALLEAQAEWEKKQRDGYTLTIAEAKNATIFKPMLAEHYNRAEDNGRRKQAALEAASDGKLFSQPKLDGVRFLAQASGAMSRANRPIVAVPHVLEALRPTFRVHPNLILDGELYNHDLRDDFNKIVSLVRKSKPRPQDLAESAMKVKYFIYDCYLPSDPLLTYSQRQDLLWDAVGDRHPEGAVIAVVPTVYVNNEVEIDQAYLGYLGHGYEGQMLRIDGPYETKRSGYLLKRKEHDDGEYEVVFIGEGEGNRSGQAGYAIVRDKMSGVEFRANITGELALRLELLREAERFIGGDVTVRHNGRTPDGIPRFPRATTWHPGGRKT